MVYEALDTWAELALVAVAVAQLLVSIKTIAPRPRYVRWGEVAPPRRQGLIRNV